MPTQTFNYTGAVQNFTVPAGVTSLTIDARGAQGSGGVTTTGRGGRAVGTFAVTPGATLYVYVGGRGVGLYSDAGFNGGGAGGSGAGQPGYGGGGASDVRTVSANLATRLLAAGGGAGGGGGYQTSGGAGGGATGATGLTAYDVAGTGGGQATGGTGWVNGALGVAGAGQGGTYYGGGGGGGGYYGGGGGKGGPSGAAGAGGGGGSNGPTAALTTNTQDYQAGDGQVILSWRSSPETFAYTGAVQTFVVPAGVTTLTAECLGAQGGANNFGNVQGGLGGRAVATFAVTPGETLNVYVGRDGTGTGNNVPGPFNGGGSGAAYTNGGGGASDVRRGTALANRIVVAGGGGSAGSGNGTQATGGTAGAGGGSTGVAGGVGSGGAGGGGGGGQSTGGALGAAAGGSAGTAGVLGVGGNAGDSAYYGGGAGGGGWQGGGGGGGGGFSFGGGGGGGGSNGPDGILTANQQGVRAGHGQVTFTWAQATPVSPASVASQWTVRGRVAPASILTAWKALGRLTAVSADARWSIQGATVATAETSWSTAGETFPVSASASTNWKADGGIVQSVGTAWQTQATITKPLVTTWKLQSGVGRTAATSWGTRTALRRTTSTTWAVNEEPFILGDNFVVQIETTPGTWLDITGDGHRIDINRHGADPGTLQYEVLDADLDPVATAAITMGDRLRVRVKKGLAGWVTIYTGAINDLQVDVNPRALAGRQVNVQLSATDNVSKLSNTPEVRGVEKISELRWLVGTTVPYVINGSSAPGTGVVVATNENGSLWDQILVTRDSNLGFAWVDGDNTLRVYDAASMDTSLKASITPAVYSDLNRDFTLDQVINQVSVAWRRYNVGTETSVDAPYGPYSDASSVAKWGPRAASFVIQGPAVKEDEATVSAYAAGVLARNSEATHRPKTATIPVNTPSRLALVRDLDLNSLVSVTYQDGVTVATMRVVGISHNVSVRNGEEIFWQTTLDFAVPDGIAMPGQTPGTGNAYIPPGSIGDDELDTTTSQRITGAAAQADAALDTAQDAFNAASAADSQITDWKYSGTTKIDGGDIQTDTVGAQQINALAINAKHSITGALVQTTTALNRGIKLNSTGLFAWDSVGNPTFNIDASTGAATFKGSILSGSSITGAAIVGSSFSTGVTGTARAQLKDNVLEFLSTANAQLGKLTTIGGGIILQAFGGAGTSLQLYGYDVIISPNVGRSTVISSRLDVETIDVSKGSAGGTNVKIWDGNLDMNVNSIQNIDRINMNWSASVIATAGCNIAGTPSFGSGFSVPASATVATNGCTISGGPTITGGPTLNGGAVLGNKPSLSDAEFKSGNQALRVTAAGVLTTSTSSIKTKENVRDLGEAIDVADVYALEPKAFNFKDREQWGDKEYGGVIAEEAEEGGLGMFVQHDEHGDPRGIDYDFLTSALLLTVRDLNARVAELEARLAGGPS